MAEVDSSVGARLQRRLQKAIEEFVEEETGWVPIRMLQTTNMKFDHWQESWSFPDRAGISFRVELKVKVTD